MVQSCGRRALWLVVMSSRYSIVVQGEASETDSDDEVYITSLSTQQAATTVGTKVPGEASETDSEEDPEQTGRASAGSQDSRILRRDLPPLIVVRDRPDVQSIVEDRPSPAHRPHGETLLQQKLQEANSRLFTDVGQMVKQVYGSASKEVHSVTSQLNASQSAIINASHSIRLILDDLKAVSEKLDIITSCQILPDINMGEASRVTAPVL